MHITESSYAHDNFGPGGIVAGLRLAAANPGTLAAFVVHEHPAHHENPRLLLRVAVGLTDLGDGPTWRFANAEGSLVGASTYALIPDWYDDQSVEHAAATLAYTLARQCPPKAAIYRVID